MGEYNRITIRNRPEAELWTQPEIHCLFDNLNFADILSISNKLKMEFVIDNHWSSNLTFLTPCPNPIGDHSINRLDSLTTFRYSSIHYGWRMVPWCNGRTGEKNIVCKYQFWFKIMIYFQPKIMQEIAWCCMSKVLCPLMIFCNLCARLFVPIFWIQNQSHQNFPN